VLDNFAFAEGKLTGADIEAIMKRVDERMKEMRKGPAAPKEKVVTE
jgi:hypothetical protein